MSDLAGDTAARSRTAAGGLWAEFGHCVGWMLWPEHGRAAWSRGRRAPSVDRVVVAGPNDGLSSFPTMMLTPNFAFQLAHGSATG